MIREHFSPTRLSTWVQLNEITLHGVSISQRDHGCAVTAVESLTAKKPLLMKVPKGLILSQQAVSLHAKSDHHLREVLDATDDFAKVSRLDLDIA